MYLAGLVADDAKMSEKDLNRWVKKAERRTRISHCTVGRGGKQPWVRDRTGVDRIRQGKRGCRRVVDPQQPGGLEGRRKS